MTRLKIIIIFGVVFGFLILPGEGYCLGLIQEYYDAPSKVAKGKAVTATTSDYSALFDNPAGLAYIPYWGFKLDVSGELSTKVIGYINTIKDLGGKSQNEVIAELTDPDNQFLEKNIHASLRVALAFERSPFSVAFLANGLNIDTSLNQDNLLTVNARTVNSFGVHGGYAHTFLDKQISAGLSLHYMYRVSVDRPFSASDISERNTFRSSLFQGGSIFDVNLGFLYRPKLHEFFQPKIGLTLSNLTGNFVFGNEEPVRFGRRAHLGFAVELMRLGFIVPEISFDIRNLGVPRGSAAKHLHFGAEVRTVYSKLLSGALRVGINQGGFTTGVYGKIWIFTAEVGYYVEEGGYGPGVNSDPRYTMLVGVHI